jgi:hypothetical protein
MSVYPKGQNVRNGIISRRLGVYHPLKGRLTEKGRDPKDWISECVDVLEYDDMTREMTVHFVMRGSYLYKDVEPQVYEEFNNAGSRGQYFNLYIRSIYESERIS